MEIVDKPSPYSPKEGWRSPGFGHASDMIHIAVNRDDADAFMRYLEAAGGPEVEVLLAGSIQNYAALHGAERCLKALFASGAKSEFPLEYWLKKAETPSYGPKAAMIGKLAAA